MASVMVTLAVHMPARFAASKNVKMDFLSEDDANPI